jgi:hypothetical protein
MRGMRSATLTNFRIESDRLFFEFNVLDRVFTTSIWYKDVDFRELEIKLGKSYLDKLVAHIAAFEANKYGSLRLESIDLGPLASHVTPSLAELWTTVFTKVWAQWRYENNLPLDKAPRLVQGKTSAPPFKIKRDSPRTLTLFGGGKDSYVSAHLLGLAGIPTDVLEYSSSIYGNRAEQVDIKAQAQTALPKAYITEMAIFDDFLDSPLVDYDGDRLHIHTLAAAETPSSLFEALPLAFMRGYTAIALGHEKSANYPNLSWEAEGNAQVNHQWGKSLEAQLLLSSYIKTHLVTNLDYYSTLMPLSDPAIMAIFAKLPWDNISQAHSCNIKKPWCRRCAKCVFVWLFYLAYLDAEQVTTEVFESENLFEVEENHQLLRMLSGLTNQTPFECVGQPPEVMLALAICSKKGYHQPIITELLNDYPHQELLATIDTQLRVDLELLEKSMLPTSLDTVYRTELESILKTTRSSLRSKI